MFYHEYNYTQHIWSDIFIAIVSVDFLENRKRVIKLQKQLLSNNLCVGYVCMGKKVKDFTQRIDAVFQCHKKIAIWFNKTKPCKYLLILEDDALVCTDNISSKIIQYIHNTDKYNKKWLAIHLGCYALSRIYKTYYTDLYIGKGYGAHSYILNGNCLDYWINKIKYWKIPYVLEKWEYVPSKRILMVHPMLFSQTVHCTGVTRVMLPSINNSKKWYKYINTINSLNIYLEELICAFLFFSILKPKYILLYLFTIYIYILVKSV